MTWDFTRLWSVRDTQFQNLSEIFQVGKVWRIDKIRCDQSLSYIWACMKSISCSSQEDMEPMVILTSVARFRSQAVLIYDRFWCERSINKHHWCTVDDCWSMWLGPFGPQWRRTSLMHSQELLETATLRALPGPSEQDGRWVGAGLLCPENDSWSLLSFCWNPLSLEVVSSKLDYDIYIYIYIYTYIYTYTYIYI